MRIQPRPHPIHDRPVRVELTTGRRVGIEPHATGEQRDDLGVGDGCGHDTNDSERTFVVQHFSCAFIES
jgi:hypothetical protein